MIFVSVLAIVRLNWIRGAVRTSATIEWNMQKEKPVSKIWNTSSETSYFTGADTLKPYKSCDAVWCTQHLKSCDVYITVLSIPNSATSLNYMILLYKTIIFNWNFPWRVWWSHCGVHCLVFCFVLLLFFFNIYWAFLSLGCLWMHIFCFKTLWKSSQRTIIAKMSLNRHVPRLFLCHVCQMNFGLITRNPVCTHVYVLETGEEGGEGAREPFAQ